MATPSVRLISDSDQEASRPRRWNPGRFLDTPPQADLWEQRNLARLRWLALLVVAVGILWRATRYFMQFPVWGDEAMLLVNYFTRDYADMFGPVDNLQIAPLLFHFANIASLKWLGSSELAMRFVPFLACLGSLFLFWRLARLTLPPLGHTLAVAIFSVSIWPATMGSLVKPYALDLFFSLALLVPTITWLQNPQRSRWLVLLVLVSPLAIAASYPSVFIAGAVGLVLLPAVWKERRVAPWVLLTLYGVLIVGTFLAHYRFVSVPHLASVIQTKVTADEGMRTYWRDGFPPTDPVRLASWLFLTHTGQMAAYPLGASNGGSIATAFLALAGMIWLWRRGKRQMVWLALGAFGLWFIAGALHKYPYGASCRLSQHVAPFYCLFAGLGVAALLLRAGDERRWQRGTLWAAGLLALVGIGGTIRDVVKPYRDEDAQWCRQVATNMLDRAGDEPIVVLQHRIGVHYVLQWYLGRLGSRIQWGDTVNWRDLARNHDSVWVFSAGMPTNEIGRLENALSTRGQPWRCVDRQLSTLVASQRKSPLEHGQVYHLVPRTDGLSRSARPSVSLGETRKDGSATHR